MTTKIKFKLGTVCSFKDEKGNEQVGTTVECKRRKDGSTADYILSGEFTGALAGMTRVLMNQDDLKKAKRS